MTIFHLSPLKKLFGQIFGSIVLIYLGIQVNIFGSPEFIFRTDSIIDTWLNIGFTILWLVTLTNAFNFIDSSDIRAALIELKQIQNDFEKEYALDILKEK